MDGGSPDCGDGSGGRGDGARIFPRVDKANAGFLEARSDASGPSRRRWDRALAAYRRAEARVAAFKAEEARLPAGRRAFPCEDLEDRFGALDGLRLAALRRLLHAPAPDLAAIALKLELAVADPAWELTGCETCLEAIQADARRLAARQSQVLA